MDGKAQIVVIGAGPGGYAAAFHAADLGAKVVLIDASPRPGGVCLHRGCIPSKALLHVAKVIQESREASRWGVTFGAPKVDLDAMRTWSASVIEKLAGGVEGLCQRRGVELIRARATFENSQTLRLEKAGEKSPPRDRLDFEHAILATGSSPFIPPGLACDDSRVMDSTTALKLPDIPGRLLVVGGGYIGLELGSVYAALGSKVTVVELTDGLLPGADRDLVRPLKKRLDGLFAAMHFNTKVAALKPTEKGVEVTLEAAGAEPKTETYDRVLVSVGRRPNTQGLGLENTAVQLDKRGFVKVDRRMRSDDPHILAIGDVAGEPMLAHKAAREGKVAAGALLGEPDEFDNVAIPAVVFTDPEIAWCGLSEAEAKASGRNVGVIRYPWAANGRALTLDRPEGLTKLVFDAETERLLGVGIVGAGAGELIAEGVLAVEMGAVARDIGGSIHAHPTLSETIGEAAEAFLGEATHLYRPKERSSK